MITINFTQGEDYCMRLFLKNAQNQPINLTGYEFAAHIRPDWDKAFLAAFTVEIPAPAAGELELRLTAEATKSLPVGAQKYDIFAQRDGQWSVLMKGRVNINGAITRP
jgi:hypothetical protein